MSKTTKPVSAHIRDLHAKIKDTGATSTTPSDEDFARMLNLLMAGDDGDPEVEAPWAALENADA